jgi:hypothetical protein
LPRNRPAKTLPFLASRAPAENVVKSYHLFTSAGAGALPEFALVLNRQSFDLL